MSSYKYDYKKGVVKLRSRLTGLKLTVASVGATLALLAGIVTPIALTHAQGTNAGGGSGGGGSTTTTTGGGGSTTTATGGGGGTKNPATTCDPVAALVGTADINTGITASFAISACTSGKTTNTLSIRNVTTGNVEYSLVDPVLNSMVYTNPNFGASYAVELSVFSSRTSSVIATKSVPVTMPVLPANCATIVTNDPHVGYWVSYAAIWLNYSAINCGYGRTTAEAVVTDLSTNTVAADYTSRPIVGLIDFEGPIVKYNNPYQVDIYIHGALGEVLDHSTTVVTSVPQL